MTEGELVKRLERLERDNRRLKQIVAVIVLAAGSLAFMGETRGTPHVVTAHEFVLLDREGHRRITISTPAALGEAVVGMQPDDPGIWISDSKGHDRFILNDDSLSFSNESGRESVRLLAWGNGASLEFLGSKNQKIGNLFFPVDRMQLSTWGLYFGDEDGKTAIELGGLSSRVEGSSPKPELMLQGAGGFLALNAAAGKSSISLGDAQGFEMDLGSTSTTTLTTGATQHTSAASIVMFGNDKKHHVIWKAP